MRTTLDFLSGQCPPEHLSQFTWIAERVIEETNRFRGGGFRVNAGSLFHKPVLPIAKHPRYLSILLAHELLQWPAAVIDGCFDPEGFLRETPAEFLRNARRWQRQGSIDGISGQSMEPLREAIAAAYRNVIFTQNPDANKPPEPPPRRAACAEPRSKVKDSRVTADYIILSVAAYYGLTAQALLSRNRSPKNVLPRHIGMYLARRMITDSSKAIARSFRRKHHTTVLHSVQKIEKLRQKDVDLNRVINSLIDSIH